MLFPLESRVHWAATPTELQLLAAMNENRVAAGVPALVWDASLELAAQKHADWESAAGVLTHVGPDGSTPFDRDYAVNSNTVYGIENAGVTGPIWSTDETYLAPKLINLGLQINAHPGHHDQLIDPLTRSVGFGIATGIFQGMNAVWLNEDFGTIQPGIPDANNDGKVDTADFTAMSDNFGTAPIGYPWESGDFNADGVVNAIDFNVLASAWGLAV
jgi:hypothetical protein